MNPKDECSRVMKTYAAVFLDVLLGALEGDLLHLEGMLLGSDDGFGLLGLDHFKSTALLEDGFGHKPTGGTLD